jgi:glycosyltransferase involved in cell wall biosynthesis
VEHRPALSPKLHRIARKFLPLYGRAPDEFRSWIPRAEAAAREQLAKSPQANWQIVSFGEPMSDHLVGLRLKEKTGFPWVAHFSDPWADNPFRKLFFFSNVFNRRMEAAVVSGADKLIFTSGETLSLVMGKYPSGLSKQAHVLPHSYDPSIYPETPSSPRSEIVVRYLGSFYGNRTPFPLLEALQKLHLTSPELLDDVRFEFIGGIPQRMMRHRSIKMLPSSLIRFLPPVSYKESLRLMKEADLLLVIDAPAALSVFLPSKLVDYLGAGVPILGIVPKGSSASLIQRMGGSVADPGDQRAIAATLAKALELCRSAKKAGDSKPWGQEDVRQEYAVERVEKQFMQILSHGGPE